jgi:putative transposase
VRQTELNLNDAGRLTWNAFRRKGVHPAREVNRAHVSRALDEGVPEAMIRRVLGVGRLVLRRTRGAYRHGGLEFALRDVPRPGQPRNHQADQEAVVAVLASSAPPGGYKLWTIRLPGAAVRERPQFANVSREAVRQMVKMTLAGLRAN